MRRLKTLLEEIGRKLWFVVWLFIIDPWENRDYLFLCTLLLGFANILLALTSMYISAIKLR